MKNDWTLIFLGVVSAVIAALLIEWMNRVFNSPTATAADAAWNRTLSGAACGPTSCALPNFNKQPDSPAYTYAVGAPVNNYRSVQRVGVLEVPVNE